LIETISKNERNEGRRERRNRLIETESKSEMGEGGREVGGGKRLIKASATKKVG
jgi:hypothetical protein